MSYSEEHEVPCPWAVRGAGSAPQHFPWEHTAVCVCLCAEGCRGDFRVSDP